MEKHKLAGLLLVAALAGEAAGVVRANHRAKKIIKNLEKKNLFLKMAGDAMAETLDDINAGIPTDAAMERFNEQRQYIEIVHNL